MHGCYSITQYTLGATFRHSRPASIKAFGRGLMYARRMKRVLVTGATGFIGRESISPLLERAFEVHALYVKEPIIGDPRVTWHKADLLDHNAGYELCATILPTHLLHFAWHVDPKDYKTSALNGAWKEATLALLHAFGESGGKRAVFAGTCMEYDWMIPQDALSENTSAIAPATIYGHAKNDTRLAAEKYARENQLSLAWGRIFNLYGPFESLGRLMPNVITSLQRGKKVTITSADRVFDYSYVRDTAGAFAALLDSDVTGAVNIASGSPVTLGEIVNTIGNIVGRTDLIELDAGLGHQGEPDRIVADVSRLSNEVGWHPQYDLHQGLAETIEWWKKNSS